MMTPEIENESHFSCWSDRQLVFGSFLAPAMAGYLAESVIDSIPQLAGFSGEIAFCA